MSLSPCLSLNICLYKLPEEREREREGGGKLWLIAMVHLPSILPEKNLPKNYIFLDFFRGETDLQLTDLETYGHTIMNTHLKVLPIFFSNSALQSHAPTKTTN